MCPQTYLIFSIAPCSISKHHLYLQSIVTTWFIVFINIVYSSSTALTIYYSSEIYVIKYNFDSFLIWCPFFISLWLFVLMSVQCQFDVGLMSVRCRFDVGLMLVRCWFDVDLIAIWIQFNTAMLVKIVFIFCTVYMHMYCTITS